MNELHISPPLEGLVDITADETAVLLEKLSSVRTGLHTLAYQLGQKTLSKDLVRTVLCLTEFMVADASKVTGVPTQSQDEIEARFSSIRAANMRIHELEKQLGETLNPEVAGHTIKGYAQKMRRWWRTHGFGYIPELHFDDYGHCCVKLSCSLSRYDSSFSSNPVTDKSNREVWLEDLKRRGYEMHAEHGARKEDLVDTPLARELISHLVATHLPSARITQIDTKVSSKGAYLLRDIHLYVRDLGDIARLDAPEDEDI